MANLEHNFGHGEANLAAVLATMNPLAFAMHTVADLFDNAWQAARAAVGTRRRFFEDLRAITTYLVFPTWASLIETADTCARQSVNSLSSTLATPPVSYQLNRQLAGWNPPPQVFRAFEAHQRERTPTNGLIRAWSSVKHW